MGNETILGYKGTVRLSIKINDKLIEVTNHNSGLPELLKSITKFLTGNGVNSDAPSGLDLKRKQSGSDTWETYLKQEIITGGEGRYYHYDESVSNWVASFTFTLPYSALIDYISEESTAAYRFYLYRKDSAGNHTDLAYIEVSATDLSKITPGLRAAINWNLEIRNVTA